MRIPARVYGDLPGGKRRGGAVLETILILPILLYLAIGTVEFGYYFCVKHSLEGAARDGCRSAIPSGAAYSDITSAVSSAMSAANLSGSGYTVTVQDHGTTVATMAMSLPVHQADRLLPAAWRLQTEIGRHLGTLSLSISI